MSGDAKEMREAYRVGQLRWPSVAVGEGAFAEYWEASLGSGRATRGPEELYLCCACAAGHPEALLAFEREYCGVAEAAIRRLRDEGDFVRDCLQELWQRLLLGDQPKVRSYSGSGPLAAWVRVAATRVALDRRRVEQRRARREVDLTESLAAPEASHEASLLKARYGAAFQDALRASVARLSRQERNVLRLHVLGRCSIDEIGVAYAVHRATAARWIERARGRIYDEVRRELCDGHRLTTSEFRSLARLLGAEVELSLGLGSLTEHQGGSAA